MSGFKLLAIRPLKGCDNKFRKNLKEGVVYKFYQDYKYFDEDKKEIILLNNNFNKPIAKIESPKEEIDLYSQGGLKINISAIVGKNGSGKSSLIELIFATIYNLSIKLKILEVIENDDGVNEKIKLLDNLFVEIYYSINENIYCLRLDDTEEIDFRIIEFKNHNIYREFEIANEYINHKSHIKLFFFYTIAINYSLYGLNSKQMGLWVKSLFHKNDGYQTPVVINPYRKKGNIDINIELYLAKQRLISNILKPNDTTDSNDDYLLLTDSQKVEYITFSLNENKIEYAFKRGDKKDDIVSFQELFKTDSKKSLLSSIYKIYFNNEHPNLNVKFKEEVEKYIIKKLIKIARTYPEYRNYFRDSLIEHIGEKGGTKNYANKYKSYFQSFETFLGLLKQDKSHLTFKLRQAINYLKNDILREEEKTQFIWKSRLDEEENEIYYLKMSVCVLSNRINSETTDEIRTIELIPPSLFDIEIHLTSTDRTVSLFSELSSGEQQLIHSVQSIVYHAINLNSVFSGLMYVEDKLTYNYLNIILDEIELYFHPDYQRRFIKELIGALERIKTIKIRNINILFSTHSPFILSDILAQNILRLEVGEPSENEFEQTFGANINDLLANDFFLRNGFMGEFAKEKINDLINYLTFRKGEKIDNNNIKPNYEWTKENAEKFIRLIGEPLLKYDLKEMYLTKFYNENELDREIEILQKIKKRKSEENDID